MSIINKSSFPHGEITLLFLLNNVYPLNYSKFKVQRVCLCFAAFVCLFVLFFRFFLLLSSHKQLICITGNWSIFKVHRVCACLWFALFRFFSFFSAFAYLCAFCFCFMFLFLLLASQKQSTSCSWDAIIYGTQLT